MTHLHTCTWGQNKRMKSAGWVIQIVHATAVVLGSRLADCVVRQRTHCRTPLSLTQQGARFISLKWSTGENMPACSSYNKKRHGKRFKSQQNKNVFFLSYHCQNFFLKRVTISECLLTILELYWNMSYEKTGNLTAIIQHKGAHCSISAGIKSSRRNFIEPPW